MSYEYYFVSTPTEDDDEECLSFSSLKEAQEASKKHNAPVTDKNGKEIKLFQVIQRQSHFETFEIEATTAQEAVDIVKYGYKRPVYSAWGEEQFYETQEIKAE